MKNDMSQKVALVTGGSSGIGAQCAIRLAKLGYKTYAAARRVDKMEVLKSSGVHVVALDLNDDTSIHACLAKIRAESGDVDVLVNNAGYGSYGALEEVPLAEGRRQLEVNLFGLAALTQQVIAPMRKKRWGRIINISSIGGTGGTPFGGWYHTSKFALEGYSKVLRQELGPFGVDVVVIRPGGIESEWADIAMDNLLKVSGNGPYGKIAHQTVETMKISGKKLEGSPVLIADLIERAVQSKKPKTVYFAPLHAKVLSFLTWLFPDRLTDRLTRMGMKVPNTW